jgi:glycosyltransferase involved in cell wall biosynthesis
MQAPYSRLYVVSDAAGWILDEETKELVQIAKRMGIPAVRSGRIAGFVKQCVHYSSQFAITAPKTFVGAHHVSIDYFHGMPQNDPIFKTCFEALRRVHPRLTRLRVSHSQLQELAFSSGIDPSKVHRIPIGINLTYFSPQAPARKSNMRARLGIPQSAVLIGSFQKDGQGWGNGLEPKLIKGPDIFLNVMSRLRESVPELHVLLTGPARGYVKAGLEARKIPYFHRYLEDPRQIGDYYQALDLYVVASRDEGGPKAILESMAAGIPLITTRVGQARDLVRHRENAWMTESEDTEGLVHWCKEALSDGALRQAVLAKAGETARANSYDAQDGLWRAFFKDYVMTR